MSTKLWNMNSTRTKPNNNKALVESENRSERDKRVWIFLASFWRKDIRFQCYFWWYLSLCKFFLFVCCQTGGDTCAGCGGTCTGFRYSIWVFEESLSEPCGTGYSGDSRSNSIHRSSHNLKSFSWSKGAGDYHRLWSGCGCLFFGKTHIFFQISCEWLKSATHIFPFLDTKTVFHVDSNFGWPNRFACELTGHFAAKDYTCQKTFFFSFLVQEKEHFKTTKKVQAFCKGLYQEIVFCDYERKTISREEKPQLSGLVSRTAGDQDSQNFKDTVLFQTGKLISFFSCVIHTIPRASSTYCWSPKAERRMSKCEHWIGTGEVWLSTSVCSPRGGTVLMCLTFAFLHTTFFCPIESFSKCLYLEKHSTEPVFSTRIRPPTCSIGAMKFSFSFFGRTFRSCCAKTKESEAIFFRRVCAQSHYELLFFLMPVDGHMMQKTTKAQVFLQFLAAWIHCVFIETDSVCLFSRTTMSFNVMIVSLLVTFVLALEVSCKSLGWYIVSWFFFQL